MKSKCAVLAIALAAMVGAVADSDGAARLQALVDAAAAAGRRKIRISARRGSNKQPQLGTDLPCFARGAEHGKFVFSDVIFL